MYKQFSVIIAKAFSTLAQCSSFSNNPVEDQCLQSFVHLHICIATRLSALMGRLTTNGHSRHKFVTVITLPVALAVMNRPTLHTHL